MCCLALTQRRLPLLPNYLVIGGTLGEARDAGPTRRILDAVDDLLLAVPHHAPYRLPVHDLSYTCHARDGSHIPAEQEGQSRNS